MGGFLTIAYCSRTMDHCFLYYFLKICEGQGRDGWGQNRHKGGSPQFPH